MGTSLKGSVHRLRSIFQFMSANVGHWCGWRGKTTSVQYVEQRTRDPTFEKFMDKHKKLTTVVKVQDIIMGRKDKSLSLEYLSRLRYKLRLKRGAASFLRKYPHIFHVYKHPIDRKPWFELTNKAQDLIAQEDGAIKESETSVIERLKKLLMMSTTGTLPLKAFFKVSRELGLPDDFEDSILLKYPQFFRWVRAENEENDMVELVSREPTLAVAAVDKWRNAEYRKNLLREKDIRFAFKHEYPPGFKIKKGFKDKVRMWQRRSYWSPYEDVSTVRTRSGGGIMRLEKRAVSILHEFLSLTVEKMVQVEQVSHFRKPYNIELNIRDLFLDHPGIFYLSTKGKVHTIFLREAYQRGNVIEPNPVNAVRRKLLDLVVLGRRGAVDLQSQLDEDRAASGECRKTSSDQVPSIEGKEELANALHSESGDSSLSDLSDSSMDGEGEEWDSRSDTSDWSEMNE
eukprot:Gb_11579 [translate_table: standard]